MFPIISIIFPTWHTIFGYKFIYLLIYFFQAQAALMYDAVYVLIEAFNRLMRKKQESMRGNSRRMSVFGNTSRALDCYSKSWVTPWEYGDKMSRLLRKVVHTNYIICFYFNPLTSFFCLTKLN